MGRERERTGASDASNAAGPGAGGAAAGDEAAEQVRYAAAVDEIERLLASIDRDEIDVDELAAKVERAVELLKVCRARLKATEARVVEVLKDLDADEAAAEAGEDDAAGGDESDDDPASRDAADLAPESSARPRKRRKGASAPPPDPDEELPF